MNREINKIQVEWAKVVSLNKNIAFSSPPSKNPYFTEGGVRKMNIVNTLLYSNFVHPLLKTLDFLNVQIKDAMIIRDN